jgi:cell wall-associated NlpC family hydrolase
MLMLRLPRRLIPLALAVAAVAALALPTSAPAAPIDDKKAEAAALEAQITENGRKLGALNEQINDAQIELDAANATIAAADAAVDAARAKTAELRAIVAQRAASLYSRSGTEGGVAELDAGSATELTTRQKYTEVAAERDQRAVDQLKRAQEELARRKADAEDARSVAAAKQEQILAVKAELDAADAKQRALLSGVKGEIAQLVQQAEAERRARDLEAAQAQQRLAPASLPAATGGTAGGGSGGGGSAPAPSGGVGAVLAYANAQLGKPYCYAGAGPNCFDCSGLTMMALAQAGLSLPHGSNAQLAMFPSVSMSELQPGDLVYWDGHVGIYVGSGSVLHAPRTGSLIQITPIWPGVIGANRPG